MIWVFVAARVKVAAMNKVNRQASARYPHSEGMMADVMLKGSVDIGEDSAFGKRQVDVAFVC